MAAGYRICIAPRGTALPDPETAPTATFAVGVLSGTINYELTEDVIYECRVYAMSVNNLISEAGPELSVMYSAGTSGEVAPIPWGLRARQIGTDTIELSWEVEAESGSTPSAFNIYRAEDLSSAIASVTYSAGQRYYRWTETPGTDGEYRYRVTSVAGDLESWYSRSAVVVLDSAVHAAPTASLEAIQES